MLRAFLAFFSRSGRSDRWRKHRYVTAARTHEFLCAALEGICTLWPRTGRRRKVPVVDFCDRGSRKRPRSRRIIGVRSFCPRQRLKKSYASPLHLTHLGRSEVLLIGTSCRNVGNFACRHPPPRLRPVQLRLQERALREHPQYALEPPRLLTLPRRRHGSPRHRQHLTYLFCRANSPGNFLT